MPIDDDDEEYTNTGTELTGTGTGMAHTGPAADETAEASPDTEAPKPEDEDTQPFDLAGRVKADVKQRRRHTRGDVTVKRKRGHEVRLSLEAGATLIGRDPSCDIVVDHPDVSREHARIRHADSGHFELIDLGSKNGTRVEGIKVSRMLLLDGDAFAVGNTSFTVHLETSEG